MIMEAKAVLDLPMPPNDAKAQTIRGYMKTLLCKMIKEGEGFNGKRPFGNSSWKFDLYTALINGGAVAGTLDSDGYVLEVDSDEADDVLLKAVEEIVIATK
jgi:hypothetical protein